jgi:hypothetical protein
VKRHFFCSVYFLVFFFAGIVCPVGADGFSALDIPEPTICYFSAVAESDLDALSQCFQPDAVIFDVSRKISGIEAIRTWAENEVIGGRYEILSIVSQSEDRIIFLIKFVPPGFGESASGFKAHYTFDFIQGKIVRMDLQYA